VYLNIGLDLGSRGASTGDPYFSSVVFLHKFAGADGATTGTAVTGQTLTFVGNAQLDTAEKKFNTASLLLDGTGDYVTVPHSADWYLPGEFTIELWARPQLAAGATKGLLGHMGSTGQFSWMLAYTYSTASAKWFRADWYPNGNSTGAVSIVQGSSNLDQGVFHHVALARDASNVMRLFVGGALAGSATEAGTFDSTNVLHIGYNQTTTAAFQGWIDSIRITKGVCRYTSAFTPPDTDFPEA
jgi:hypothetical protein